MNKLLIIGLGLFWMNLHKLSAAPGSDTSFIQPTPKDTLIPDQKLEEVVIQSIHIQNKHLRSPTPVQIMDQSVIERLNSLSVADAVRYFSGIQLKDYGGIGGLKTINVRSMGSQHSTVFYNGMPLGNMQNGQVDLGKFSLSNIKEIKLYNAQNSNIFQPAKAFASGASLYLESKTPEFKNHKKTHIETSFKTGSFGLANPEIRWEQRINKHISIFVSSEYTYSNGRYPFRYTNGVYDTTATRYNADISAWRLELGLNGTLPDSSKWHIQGYHYQSERGLPGAVVSNHFENHQRLWNKDQFVQAHFLKPFTKKYTFKVNAKYSRNNTRYLDPFFPNAQGKLDNHYHEKSFYFSLANKFEVTPFLDIDVSTDYLWDKLDADLYHFAYPKRKTFLAVIAGNLHFNRFTLQGSLLGTFVKDQVQQYADAGNKSEYTPTLSVSWQPFAQKGLWLRGFYKDIFRMPTFNDLYYTFIGNTRLRPEYVKQFDVGFTYHKTFDQGIWKYTALTIDGYHNRVRDKIVAVPGTNLFRWSMQNLGKVDIKGLDAQIENRLLISRQIFLKISLSYTFQQALNVTPNGYNYKNQIPYIPKHSGSATASIDWNNWALNYSYIYTGERYSQAANIPQNYVPAWYTHDFSVRKKWILKNFQWTAFAEINNLANQHYDVVLNFPMPGRSYRLGFSIQL